MSDVETLPERPQEADESTNDLADPLAKVSIADEDKTSEATTDPESNEFQPPLRPAVVYTRPQMLFLYRSPLVHVPQGMPVLKDWFGEPNLQSLAKDADTSVASGTNRDRRFRRDPDDTDALPRPQFRSTLSQPSQMGNFKHQSLRTGDRDRDREADKERDKEGLRSLSDKFDRDRLAHPSNSTLVRNRERDSAPHLAAGSSSRTTATIQATNGTSRRSDAREATRRRVGEASDDWRRGSDPVRGAKDDRSDVSRRDRDDRERPRSRVRDSSRSRRDTSTVRRERDRDERDKDRRSERDSRKDRDDRDVDDDSRRWRDDGKRDERLAARRDRERDRDKDRTRDTEWDSHDRSYDRFRGDRWTPADDKDSRSKRGSGRERRDEKDDRRDREREREREKEKEPAWMETYVPTSSSAGILGSKSTDGELDSIQAWKKEQKEKEQKEKGPEANSSRLQPTPAEDKASAAASAPPDGHLDEIQLFKLMIKKEEEKRKAGDSPVPGSASEPGPKASTPTNGFASPPQGAPPPQSIGKDLATVLAEQSLSTATSRRGDSPATASDGPRSLLSIIASGSTESASGMLKPRVPSEIPQSIENSGKSMLDSALSNSPASPQFNPPVGSRLLAFGSRGSLAASQSHAPNHAAQSPALSNGSALSASGLSQGAGMPGPSAEHPRIGSDTELNYHRGASHLDSLQAQQTFSPFDDLSRPFGSSADQARADVPFGQTVDPFRRSSVVLDRGQFGQGPELMSAYSDLSGRTTPLTQSSHGLGSSSSLFEQSQSFNGPGGLNHAAAKGSRFAKFFDSKARESQLAGPGKVLPHGAGLPIDHPMQRHEQSAMLGGGSESRTMDDIFAMLNNSTQGQRVNPAGHINHLQPTGSSVHNQNQMGLHSLQQQQQHQLRQQQQQQNLLSSRLDSLPDHRLDDRNFVPDGMVPGLRTAPPPRGREPANALYADQLDEPLQVNYQRLPQQRSLDPLFNGSGHSGFPHPVARNGPLPLQQPHFRGGPSPIASQSPLHMPGPQRIPPGLAHLGGRPPHDTSQFLPGSASLGSGGPGSGLQSNPSPQAYNHLSTSSNGLNFGNGPQMRGMQQSGPPQLQNHLAAQSVLAGLGHPNNLELRGGSNQSHLAQLGNPSGLRPGFPNAAPQQSMTSHLQAQQLASLRQQQQQQQQQQMPPQMLSHMLPPHLQQQGMPGPNASPAASDLMALLMGGPRRD
ncbi:hypothetical protein OE88DRAFT_1651036 [Heliocybe sulcata]|uniref:Uncharacterized protein n=1 Tax=Heliocybe sulcata TaxID=5364 RepID=A0A5C3NKC5_9AGAM|nr:hypothetical protein OE88DRAFT_1651036 [Heliocybe sulcata]